MGEVHSLDEDVVRWLDGGSMPLGREWKVGLGTGCCFGMGCCFPKLVQLVEELVEKLDEELEWIARRRHYNHWVWVSQRQNYRVMIDCTYRPRMLSNQLHGAAGVASTATPFSTGAATAKALEDISTV